MILLVTALVAAQLHVLDNTREPWATAMTRMQHDDFVGARTALEAYGARGDGVPWERAHAYAQAGELARRSHDLASARNDYLAAERTDPRGFDGKMAVVHLGEMAMEARQWREAESTLARMEHDSDGVVRAYATARLHAVRERVRRLLLRDGSVGWLCVCAIGLAGRTVRSVRRLGWRRVVRSMGNALLITEAVAIVGGVVVPRWFTLFAASGWMAFAIPAGVVVALTWATRNTATWRSALTIAVLAIALASGLYLALDITWWSVDGPRV